jgi:BlaI family penicillinase repressor
MCRKGLIDKRSEGRTDYYSPVYTLENATSHFINKVFDGAIDKYVISMLSAEKVSPDEMRALEKMIAKARKSKQMNEEE